MPGVIFAFRWGAQKRCPSRGAGASTQWMDDRLYSRRCDVTKPQLAIGLFSRADRLLKGPGVGRAQHSGHLVMHLEIVEAGQ
jgi:hypothetical protein